MTIRLNVTLVVLIAMVSSSAADDLTVMPDKIDSIAPHRMLHDYLMKQVLEALQRRRDEYESIKTRPQIVAYQARMRQFFIDHLGGFPQRTPLAAQVVGSERRDGYRIEKVIFESQPGHFVTSVLYLPDRSPPFPAVLVPCGHSATGKARDLYQRAPILMAKCGMAALCYDPIDQGERHQLVDESGTPVITRSTEGHNLVGVGACLLGRNTATYRVWDGMRAIDYLVSRPEIDSDKIGCTGISGGGTLTSYLMALDDRIQAAAPGCYLNSYQRLLQTIGPQDAEQTIYNQIGFGLDHADFVLMRAARPTLIMTATEDYFDIRGAWDSFRQAKRWYGRLGFSERVDLIEVASGHGFPREMRVAAARWMRRWLDGKDDALTETDFPIATEQQLQCTPRGEVMLLPGARSVYDLNAELENLLVKDRTRFWSDTPRDKAMATVRRISGVRPVNELPPATCTKVDSIARDDYRVEKLILRTEPGIWLPTLLFVPAQPNGEATLYVHADGKQADAGPGGPMEQLVRQGQLVMAPDLRGIGETSPEGEHSYASYLPADWSESTLAYLLGKSILAMRAEDILVSARFLAEYGAAAPSVRIVHLHSVGRVGPAALHAAALEPELFASTVLQRSLISWSNVVHTPLSVNQYTNLVHGALRKYDLPDLCRAIPEGKLEVRQPLDAAEQPLKPVR
jgi:cephalosporin-C deacetylase-like acetyl esterase